MCACSLLALTVTMLQYPRVKQPEPDTKRSNSAERTVLMSPVCVQTRVQGRKKVSTSAKKAGTSVGALGVTLSLYVHGGLHRAVFGPAFAAQVLGNHTM